MNPEDVAADLALKLGALLAGALIVDGEIDREVLDDAVQLVIAATIDAAPESVEVEGAAIPVASVIALFAPVLADGFGLLLDELLPKLARVHAESGSVVTLNVHD